MARRTTLIATALLLTAGGVTAGAAVAERAWQSGEFPGGGGDGRTSGALRLQRLDANKDGAVTIEEFLKPRAERFAGFDNNKDGAIDAVELDSSLRSRLEQHIGRMMMRLDKNQDGTISRQEFESRLLGDRGPRTQTGGSTEQGQTADRADVGPPRGRTRHRAGAWREKRFGVLDANGDGHLEVTELMAAQTETLAYRARRMAHVLDRDKDGRITSEEFLARARERFELTDLNSDGKITGEDLPPAARSRWNEH